MSTTAETFENIHYDISRDAGRLRFAETGLGWKVPGGKTATLDGSYIANAQWSRAAKGFELRIGTRNVGIVQFDGFAPDDHDRLAKCLKLFYDITLEQKEHALQGWNWGKTEFTRSEIVFSVRNRPAFEIPLQEVLNTNLAGKNEVAVEFKPYSKDTNGEAAKENGQVSSAIQKNRKLGSGKDELMEMRFYIPGNVTTTKKEPKEEGSDADEDAEDEEEDEIEEQNAASLFYDQLMEKAEIGEVAGDTIVSFHDILHLTPRGRFDIDMYETSFRLRGKTYDYKILYESVKKFLVLPKPDDVHTLICIGLDPPLRQGQTRYPFLVIQCKIDDLVELHLNMTQEQLDEKYKGKLQLDYDTDQPTAFQNIFRGLSGKRVVGPSPHFKTHHEQAGVKCSIKASEGHLYCLDKSFMFAPKPATYISLENVLVIVLSRVGGAVASSRTFDVTMELKNGNPIQFSNINREEQAPLESFFKTKGLKIRNEMLDDGASLIKQALVDAELSDDDDDLPAVKADRGSADEDDESVDEDFQAESESDVAEEYDSNAESSGGESGDEEGGDDEEEEDVVDDEDDDDEERPKKKSKTG